MRSPASSEQRDRPSGLLCGRLLLPLVESVLRPGGWENMCRLMCHCVRHIGLDNKHGRSVEAIHSFLSRWTACTELCSGTQEEPRCKKSSMGSENRRRRFRGNLKSSVTRSIAPERAALENRRYLRKDCSCRRAANAMQTEAQKGYEYSTSSATYAVKPGGTDRIKADFRNLR